MFQCPDSTFLLLYGLCVLGGEVLLRFPALAFQLLAH